MLKCPKCEADIEYLQFFDSVSRTAQFMLGGVYEGTELLTELMDGEEYRCPECNEILFTDEKAATDFINGGA